MVVFMMVIGSRYDGGSSSNAIIPVGARRCGPKSMRLVKASLDGISNPTAAISAKVKSASVILPPHMFMTSLH